MSLQKNVYTPGQWYPYFYVPPKSPEMSLYYNLVEREISRLYRSVLPKDQVLGKILDFLSVPNIGGKIQKSKLHKIFIFETSAKGKKLLDRQENPVKEVKLVPPKSEKRYEGPFKFFISKNSRKLSEVSSKPRGCESVSSKMNLRSLGEPSKPVCKKPVKPYEGPFKLFQSKNSRTSEHSVEVDVRDSGSRGNTARKPAVKADRARAPPVPVISGSSDESDVEFVPHRIKMKERTTKKHPKQDPEWRQRSEKSNSQKVVRNRRKTPSSLWYENTVSSESSRSYSVESDEDFAVKSIAPKNRCFSSDQNDRAGTSDAGNANPNSRKLTQNRDAPGAKKTSKPKTFNILSSADSDSEVDLTLVTKPVAESRSACDKSPSASSKQGLSQVLSTLGSNGTALDESHSKDWLSGLSNAQDPPEEPHSHLASSKPFLPDEHVQSNMFDPSAVNPNKKTVEFKNVEYYYYTRDTSSSLTQQSSSSHWPPESKAGELKIDSSSDENDYDTGLVSPVMMSQDSQFQSQDLMKWNSTPSDLEPRDLVWEKVRPHFPRVSPKRVFPGSSGSVEQSPRSSPPSDKKRSLVLQNVRELKYSPVLSQHLSSASPLPLTDLGGLPLDLDLIRRIGSLKSVDEESLSQVSAATEIISARIMVDLRNPGALEAIQQHCRSIMEAVNSQNVLSAIPISLAEPRSMLQPASQKESSQLAEDPIGIPQQTSSIGKTIAVSETGSPIKTFLPSTVAENTTSIHPTLVETERRRDDALNISFAETASQRSRMPSVAGESVSDECISIISQPNDGSKTKTAGRRKKLPFKKRWPVLAGPKLNIISFNDAVSAPNASPKKSSASVSLESPSATVVKTSTTGSVKTANSKILPPEIISAGGVIAISPKKTTGPTYVRRSSVACVNLTRSVNQAVDENVEHFSDTIKALKLVNSADPPNIEWSSATREETAGSAGFARVKRSSGVGSSGSMNEPTAANAKTSLKEGAASVKSSSAASFKTASPMNSAAATNRSSLASIKAKSDGQPQDANSLAAGKHNVSSQLDSEQLPQREQEAATFQQNRGCGSHSSKGSLKEWQRQANLVWKMTLPHISQQFFNDPEMRDVRAIYDDLASRSGVTVSEPSSRVRVRNAAETQPNFPANPEQRLDETNKNVDRSDEVYLEETCNRDAIDKSRSPSPKSNLGALSPFMRDFLFNEPSKSLYPNDVDPDAETQWRSQDESNVDVPSPERNYSPSLDSILDMSIASRSTAEKAIDPLAAGQAYAGVDQSAGQASAGVDLSAGQASAGVDQSGPPYPAWWQREYSTPKRSLLEEDSASDDSMQVILPRSQVQREEALNSTPPAVDDSFLRNYDPPREESSTARRSEVVAEDTLPDAQRRTSTVQTRLLNKPPTLDNQRDEHDFFLSFAQRFFRNSDNDK